MGRDDLQPPLFDKGEWWDEHWKDMPEFVQKDVMPFKTVYVHFGTRAEMDAFARLIGQPIHLTTKSLWYPEAEIQHWDKQYVDSEPDDDSDTEMLDAQ